MSQPQFDIQIGKDGKVVVKVSGVSGKECTALSDMLKEIVGREESRETTAEYYGAPANVHTKSHAEVRDRRPG